MLAYLYTYDYDDESSTSSEAAPFLKEQEAGEGHGSMPVTASEPNLEVDVATIVAPESPGEEATLATVKDSETESTLEESRLLNNVIVYAIAEKYDIFELKELAKTKFLNQADTLMSSNDYPEVIRTIYKSTPSTDRGLRDIVSRVCVTQVRELMENQDFRDVICSICDFGLDVLDGTIKHDDEQLAQVKIEKSKLKDKVKETEVEMHNLEIDMNQAKDTLKRAVQLVNTHSSCRYCSAGFCSHLDENIQAWLVCTKCGMRQR
jgi:hypothetical protein